jgi:FtsP/CotA-like multicopper oxidase with cupredoxin domain
LIKLDYSNCDVMRQIARASADASGIAMDDGWEPYWRDNVLIAPGKTSHVAFVADNPGHWPIESTIAEHMAAGVMTTFAVG